MAGLRDIKRRINSVKSTQKITRAMKMVAASKLRRAQEAILRARPYAFEMRQLVNNIAARADDMTHPLLRAGNGGKVGIVVVTSDRGLCGGFNANVIHGLLRVINSRFADREVEITIVGRKGVELLKRRALNVRATFVGIHDGPVMRAAAHIIDDIVEDFKLGGTDEVYCVYNEFKSAVQQSVTVERLLPFAPEKSETADGDEASAENAEGQTTQALDYIYEPDQEEVFERLLVRHIRIQMHRILFESAASEHGARMTAMDAATRNAGEVIGRLTLKYNRARQDAITKELIEVVSGAEAL
ncbi:MAG TPA: ATP synthase F1 subunit gamma [Candidatus Hydrogenedentes bacterium]|nr:ATP synthase F1 subunit gamma [Candidatus Hydrogenedentota bacterium]